ncbi:MAG: hypothetical protein IH628_04900 [Proteobacteria bacterium]|nr:hypothetical protein [Pseudomonadota bacterium]
MKIRTMIPAIIALVILVGGPFGFGPLHETDPRGGLICYCGCAMGEHCTMISCAGCCGAHAGASADRWSPDMILLGSLPPRAPFKVAYCGGEAIRSPEAVYLEVPDKPPKRV